MAKEVGFDVAEKKANPNQNQVGKDARVSRRPNFGKLLLIAVPFLIIAGFYIATQAMVEAFDKPKEKEQSFNTLAVRGEYAKSGDVVLRVETQGEARPRTEIDLVPEVGGKIVYVSPNFIDGGLFKKGETLFRIDDSDFKIAVIRAESGVAQAEQLLAREIAEGEIARKDFDELGTGQPTALALRQPQRQQAEAALQAAQAEVEAAKLRLNRTYVKAPFTGRVRSKNSDIGQFVSPGFRLGRIFSTGIFEVRLPLTDADLAKLELPIAFSAKNRETAPIVKLTAQVAGKTQIWEARIMRTDSSFDTQTRTLSAIAEVVDPYGKGLSNNGMPLAPGLFISAAIEGVTYKNAIILPRDGLRPDDYVYLSTEEGKGEIRKVSVIDANADRAAIGSGIAEGDLVILSPMEKSRVNMRLKVIDVNDSNNVLREPPPPEPLKPDETDIGEIDNDAWKKSFENTQDSGNKKSTQDSQTTRND